MSPHQTEKQKWPCPHCGYTKEDAAIQMDHHLCKGPRSSAPGAKSRPCASNAELERRREREAALEAALKLLFSVIPQEGDYALLVHSLSGTLKQEAIDLIDRYQAALPVARAALSGGTAALDAVVAEATRELRQERLLAIAAIHDAVVRQKRALETFKSWRDNGCFDADAVCVWASEDAKELEACAAKLRKLAAQAGKVNDAEN